MVFSQVSQSKIEKMVCQHSFQGNISFLGGRLNSILLHLRQNLIIVAFYHSHWSKRFSNSTLLPVFVKSKLSLYVTGMFVNCKQ